LRFTTVESDTLKPQTEIWNVRALLQDAEKGADAKVECDASVTPQLQIAVDKTLSVEILKNLIENAFKFNDKAEKKVVVSAAPKGKFVAISVKDNGVGIPVEEKEKVFQKFYQIENSFTGQVPGAGLGLALCKKAIEAMGGQIHLESELGRGTTVVVQFPAAL
jgi:signal transduction histidine kinase